MTTATATHPFARCTHGYGAILARTLANIDAPVRLAALVDQVAACRKIVGDGLFPTEAREVVRTISYRTGDRSNARGVVTGIADHFLRPGDTVPDRFDGFGGVRVVLVSAGCAHPRPYVIPAGAVIEDVAAR